MFPLRMAVVRVVSRSDPGVEKFANSYIEEDIIFKRGQWTKVVKFYNPTPFFHSIQFQNNDRLN